MADIYQLEENDVTKYMKSHAKAVDGLLDFVYPVGSIYQSTKSTSPDLLFGGTWERYAKGRVLVGVDEADTDFTAGKTGGEKKHKLTLAEMASHTHKQIFSSSATAIGNSGRSPMSNNMTTTSEASSITSAGEDSPHNNLQPYISVYMWRRIA